MNFSYCSQGTAVYFKSFIQHTKQTHIEFKCYITLDITIFNNSFSTERYYECQILLCRILFALGHKNNLLP